MKLTTPIAKVPRVKIMFWYLILFGQLYLFIDAKTNEMDEYRLLYIIFRSMAAGIRISFGTSSAYSE